MRKLSCCPTSMLCLRRLTYPACYTVSRTDCHAPKLCVELLQGDAVVHTGAITEIGFANFLLSLDFSRFYGFDFPRFALQRDLDQRLYFTAQRIFKQCHFVTSDRQCSNAASQQTYSTQSHIPQNSRHEYRQEQDMFDACLKQQSKQHHHANSTCCTTKLTAGCNPMIPQSCQHPKLVCSETSRMLAALTNTLTRPFLETGIDQPKSLTRLPEC